MGGYALEYTAMQWNFVCLRVFSIFFLILQLEINSDIQKMPDVHFLSHSSVLYQGLQDFPGEMKHRLWLSLVKKIE